MEDRLVLTEDKAGALEQKGTHVAIKGAMD